MSLKNEIKYALFFVKQKYGQDGLDLFSSTKIESYEDLEFKNPYVIELEEGTGEVERIQTEGIYQCKVCKSKTVYLSQMQTRGCDEGMTTKLECSVCHKKWSEC
jgi:DNA-directed RNA polymerase subunit M/transcription elongation factor TFIIS